MTLTVAPPALAKARADFPGMVTAEGAPWHYLDTGATAQKPQAVIDATVRAMGADYATVHRGVYARSAEMTLAYEAARRRVAAFIGGREDEVVFTRGATEAINLVAQTWGAANLKAGDRVLLSLLEHHSNIVPWQLLAARTGVAIDVCPLTADGRIDLDAAEAMLTPAHRLVSFAHVSNVLGSVLDVSRAAQEKIREATESVDNFAKAKAELEPLGMTVVEAKVDEFRKVAQEKIWPAYKSQYGALWDDIESFKA